MSDFYQDIKVNGNTILGANIDSPTLVGTPVAPTPTLTDNTTKVATTEFVKSQGYVTASEVVSGTFVIDGGTF